MYNLIITLKSDLCSADGDGCASAIDTDVCVDSHGLPVIPARRLKGCLKETASLVDDSDIIDEIFGVTGSDKGCPLHISDAELSIVSDLIEAEENCENITSSMITNLFTYVRASTAIDEETGSANEQSLRYMRVVKHYSPIDGSELTFTAHVELPDKYETHFSRICKALRNIGYKRNRGFGAVCCELVKNQESQKDIPEYSFSPNKDYVIHYTVKLTDDIMLPGRSSTETLDFIPGTSVLGFFANEYLKTHNADNGFEDRFLKNGLIFSNLYISDKKGTEYFPAPVIAGKIKTQKEPVNLIEYDSLSDDKIAKPLKSGYTNTSLNIKKPLTETVYHINKTDGGNLYTQTALRKGQYFSGTISGRGDMLEDIYHIMCNGIIRVGRSKTAQYSTCRIMKENFLIKPAASDIISVKKGDYIAASAVSDILISDGMCGYCSDMTAFTEAVSDAFGFDFGEPDNSLKIKRSALKFRTIHGFNSQWKLSKPHIRAIAAGSTAIFRAAKDADLPESVWIGDKNGEGFGCVRLIKSSELAFRQEKKDNSVNFDIPEIIRSVEETEKMRTAALNYAGSHILNISSSQINRAILMAKQSENYEDFRQRIDNISEEKTRKALNEYLFRDTLTMSIPADHWREFIILLLTLEKYKARTKENNV